MEKSLEAQLQTLKNITQEMQKEMNANDSDDEFGGIEITGQSPSNANEDDEFGFEGASLPQQTPPSQRPQAVATGALTFAEDTDSEQSEDDEDDDDALIAGALAKAENVLQLGSAQRGVGSINSPPVTRSTTAEIFNAEVPEQASTGGTSSALVDNDNTGKQEAGGGGCAPPPTTTSSTSPQNSSLAQQQHQQQQGVSSGRVLSPHNNRQQATTANTTMPQNQQHQQQRQQGGRSSGGLLSPFHVAQQQGPQKRKARDSDKNKLSAEKQSLLISRLYRGPQQQQETPSPKTKPKTKPTKVVQPTESVWAKLYESGMSHKMQQERQRTAELRKRQHEEQDTENCTFKPSITPAAQSIPITVGCENVYERLSDKDQEKKVRDFELLKERIEKDRYQDCTFEPNKTSKQVGFRIPKDRRNKKTTPKELKSTCNRLYKDALDRDKRRQVQLEKAIEMEDRLIKVNHMKANWHFAQRELYLQHPELAQLHGVSNSGEEESINRTGNSHEGSSASSPRYLGASPIHPQTTNTNSSPTTADSGVQTPDGSGLLMDLISRNLMTDQAGITVEVDDDVLLNTRPDTKQQPIQEANQHGEASGSINAGGESSNDNVNVTQLPVSVVAVDGVHDYTEY